MSEYIKREDAKYVVRNELDAFDHVPWALLKKIDKDIDEIPAAELPERCIAKITFDEDKFKEIADEAIREVVVRCTECRHRRLCDQCTEQNGKMYHIEFCSRGERERGERR